MGDKMPSGYIPIAIQRDAGVERPICDRHLTCRPIRSLYRKDTRNPLCFSPFCKKLRKQGKPERRNTMKGRERFLKIVLFLFMIVPATWSAAAFGATLILNVPSDYPTIQEAIAAAGDGDTVLVASDIKAYSVPSNEGLIIEKPIKILHEGDPKECIIDCQGNGRAFTFSGPGTEGSVLSGFTIKGGNVVDSGGGISCEDGATPTISNCIITGNTATLYGGGLYCYNSSPIITGCTITKNMAGIFGGGVYLEANSSPAISNCMITGNSTAYCGGGILCTMASSPLITNSTVADNRVTDATYSQGGGIYMYGGSMPTITNSVFWNNAALQGPEIYMENDCILKISYSDIKGGKEEVSGDMPTSTAISTASTTNSILDWSDTNKNDDPRFVDEETGNYHLASDSPCIEAGTNDVVNSGSTDFEGQPRIIGLNVDIGADEAQTESEDEIEVDIDVRPGSHHNKIDLGAWGFLPVAVLSTDDFDATLIDPKTVEFAGAEPMHWVRAHVNRDRRADMLFFFWIRHLDFDLDENGTKAPVSTEAILTGETKKGQSIIGTDTVTVINPKHKRHWWFRFEQMSQKKVQCNSK
jgi:parallel beta-helix repeat protein